MSVPCVITKPSTSVRLRQLVDAFGELQQDVEAHILRADVRDLLAFDVGQVGDAGNGRDHRVDVHRARRVARLRAGGRGAGDRAARRQNHDVRLVLAGCRRELRAGRSTATMRRQSEFVRTTFIVPFLPEAIHDAGYFCACFFWRYAFLSRFVSFAGSSRSLICAR